MTINMFKRNSKQRTEKVAPPFTSLPTKFKTRFYAPDPSWYNILLFSSKILAQVRKFCNMNALLTWVI